MHGMNDDVNVRNFGGLARYMPITFATFGLGYLALIGSRSCPGTTRRTPSLKPRRLNRAGGAR